jgi:hypothetical protein
MKMADAIYRFIIAALAVWRVTHLISGEGGPWNIIRKFRKSLDRTIWGDLVTCFLCLSLWVAIPFSLLLGTTVKDCLLLSLALSGAAILLERATYAPPPLYFEEEDQDGLLRKRHGVGPGETDG